MLAYIITGNNLYITDPIREYIEKRLATFGRFGDKKTKYEIFVRVSKNTTHDRGEIFSIDVQTKIQTKDFFVTAENQDLYHAIDTARDELWQEVTRSNTRERTLFHRGARKIKDLMRGISRRRKN